MVIFDMTALVFRDVTPFLNQSEAVKIQYGRPNQSSPPIRKHRLKVGLSERTILLP